MLPNVKPLLKKAVAAIGKAKINPGDVAIVLGSAFGDVFADTPGEVRIPYSAIPGFPSSQVHGHKGELVSLQVHSRRLLVLSGRAHYYEGHTLECITFPIRVLAALGVRVVLLTNAAGGIRSTFRPGDFMVINDHINFMGVNPLGGSSASDGSGFVDLSAVYDPILRKGLKSAMRHAGQRGHEGVYIAVSGPSYETPAEIRAFRRLGADAVGMSTVPEAIVARQCGLRVAALSCITNPAAGTPLQTSSIRHEDVTLTGKTRCGVARQILDHWIQHLD